MSNKTENQKKEMPVFGIEKRKVHKSKVNLPYKRKDTGEEKVYEYSQYRINLPKDFVEEHDLEDNGEVFLLSDSIGMFLPDEKSLMKALVLIPDLRELINSEGPLSEEEIQKILEIFPELKDSVLKEETE